MEESMEKLLTVEEVMKTLRISRPTLYRLLKSGKLEPVRIGKRVLFEIAEIRAFIGRSKGGEGQQKEQKKQKKQAVQKTTRKEKQKPVRERKVKQRKLGEPEAPKEQEKAQTAEKPKGKKKVEKPLTDEDKQGRLL